jgi:NAD-dependent dihydropyrimidine dehydrogenase PreA subunit
MIYLRNVATITLDDSKCNGCGECVQVCPRAVLAMAERKAHIANRDACIECGACKLNCATAALSVDSGVGCAAAMIRTVARGAIRGNRPAPPACGCSGSPGCG